LNRHYRAKRNTNLTQLSPPHPLFLSSFLFLPRLFSSEINGVTVLAEEETEQLQLELN